jgi:acyl-CoA thioester hydrolase
MDMSERLANHPVKLEIPVWWGDQDAFGHVNNTVYLSWFESSRIEYADRIGLTTLMAERRIGPILASVRCDFRRQVRFPDRVVVGTRITSIGRTSLTMDHVILGLAAGQVVAEGGSVLVVYDYAADRPIPVPDDLRARIEAIEGGALSPRSDPSR